MGYRWKGISSVLFHIPKWISDGLGSTRKKCITLCVLWTISLGKGHEHLLWHKKAAAAVNVLSVLSPRGWLHLLASPRRSPPWSLLWCISTMALLYQWPTASGRTQQCLDPTAIELLYGFPPEERAWGGHSAPLHRAVLIPQPESRPRLQHQGLAYALP